MIYALEQMTTATWDLVGLALKDVWRNIAIQRGWKEDISHRYIAINESRDSWLCTAPVFVRDRYSAWFFFHFEGKTYCFRIDNQSKAKVEFYKDEPALESYERFQAALICAFSAFGFFGDVESQKTSFVPNFPALRVGGAQ